MDNHKILVVVMYACIIIPTIHSVFKDVVFVVDRSGSIAVSDLKIGLEFVFNVSDWLTIGPHDIDVSLITFSDTSKVEIGLGINTNHKSLMNALRNITTDSMDFGGTNTENALQCVEKSFKLHGRTGAKKVVVILTDGASSNTHDTIQQADLLRQRFNASIFAVGIGSAATTSNRELQGLASEPTHYFLHKVHQFIYLCNLIPSIVPKLDPNATAKAIANCPTPPTTLDINIGVTDNWIAKSVVLSTSRGHGINRGSTDNLIGESAAASTSEDNGINTGLIAGATTAAVAAVLSGAAALVLIRRKLLSNKLVPKGRPFPMTGNYVNAPNGQPNVRFDPKSLR